MQLCRFVLTRFRLVLRSLAQHRASPLLLKFRLVQQRRGSKYRNGYEPKETIWGDAPSNTTAMPMTNQEREQFQVLIVLTLTFVGFTILGCVMVVFNERLKRETIVVTSHLTPPS